MTSSKNDSKKPASDSTGNKAARPLGPESERVHKFLTEDLTVRASSVIATQVVEEMRAVHNSSPIPTVAVGRAMVGALLMASHLKDSQELSLYFRGNGPLVSVFAEATFEGRIRAYCGNPVFEGDIPESGIKTGEAIGIGLLTVTHHLPVGGIPHRGTVEIATGEIGDDIAYYLHQSHQIQSVVALGIHVNRYGRVEAAGGVLIELMPGHTQATLDALRERVKSVQGISKRILEGATAKDLVQDYLADINMMRLEHDHPIEYFCRCSTDRVQRSVALLGITEVDDLISKAESLDINCDFCGKKYILGVPELEAIRKDLFKASLN
jgi:molecular chaperone Hsp33